MPPAGHGLACPLLPLLLLLLCLTWPALAPRGAIAGPSCPDGCACHLDSFGRFSSYSLTRVDCSSSGLRDFPAALPLTTTHLSLVDNHLGPTVNPGGPGYTTLLALNLSHNGVTRLHKGTFSRLRYLDALDLSYNAVGQVDAGAFERAPLSTIDLSHNALSDEFDLSAFEADLPVIGVQRLSLDLSHNRISALKRKGGGGGGAPAGTLRIRSLNLAANALMEAPPPELLRHLADLQYLSLDSNPITRLRQSAFFYLRDLTHLSLRNLAPDVQFYRGTFRGLEGTLQVLDLSDNCQSGVTLVGVELGELRSLFELQLSVSDDPSLALLPATLGLPLAGAWKCWEPRDPKGRAATHRATGGCVNVACYRFPAREML